MKTIPINTSGVGGFYGSTSTCSNKKNNRGKSTARKGSTKKSGKITVHKTISAQTYLIRLANAKNTAQVSNVMRCARVEANSIRSITNSETAAANAKRIAKAIEKKGKLKVSRLKKEEALRRQKEIQEALGHAKKAALTAKKLHRKRNARKAEERADITNSVHSYKKEEEEYKNTSPYASDTADIGLIVDVCVSTDTLSADIAAGTGVDVAL